MSGNNLNVPLLSLGSSKLWGFAIWELLGLCCLGGLCLSYSKESLASPPHFTPHHPPFSGSVQDRDAQAGG